MTVTVMKRRKSDEGPVPLKIENSLNEEYVNPLGNSRKRKVNSSEIYEFDQSILDQFRGMDLRDLEDMEIDEDEITKVDKTLEENWDELFNKLKIIEQEEEASKKAELEEDADDEYETDDESDQESVTEFGYEGDTETLPDDEDWDEMFGEFEDNANELSKDFEERWEDYGNEWKKWNDYFSETDGYRLEID